MPSFETVLQKADINCQQNISLRKYSTIKVGGPAKFFVEVRTVEEAAKVYKLALQNEIAMFVLGGGSNVLISDKGFDGLVIKNSITGIEFSGKEKRSFVEQTARKQETHWNSNLLSLDDISFTPSENLVITKIFSGTLLPYTLTYTIERDATGLQIFAGIPGTIGGALWNNIHGAKWLIGQFTQDITYIDELGEIQTKTPQELHFDYNQTDFKKSNNFILSATFTLFDGGKQKAREIANEWISRKKIQPKNSLGCAFSNLTEEQRDQAGLENLSAGYVIDKILGLKGFKIGGAQVSESHSNFIVTNESATAKDYLELVEKIKNECFEKTGLILEEEIVKVGDFS